MIRPHLLAAASLTALTQPVVAAQNAAPIASLADSSGLPLQPARAVRFRMSEGTWMSLDVSPDGRTIVFDLLGDLYTLPIAGGKATRITSGMALNRQPRFSPDGKQLVFVSDRSGSENVWVADRSGGHARRISNLHGYDGSGAVTSPTWSPDGRTIVVSQRLGASRLGGDTHSWRWLLAAYDAATGRMRWISDTAPDRARSTLGAAFGPDGRFVYAAVDAFRKDPWLELPGWRIAQVDLVAGRVEPEMGANVGRVGMRPVLSPDGRHLAYATSSGSHLGLRLRELATNRERWLVRELLDDPPFEAHESRDLVPGYAFTPDSRSLIAAYGGKIHRLDLVTGRAAVIPFVAEVERWLGPSTVHQFALPDTAVRTRSVLQPALSADGRQVAFSALDRIWIMELPYEGRPAGQPWRLTADSIGEFYPSWSPDGRWIAYSTWRDGEGGAIRRARVSGASEVSERLTADTALYFHTAVTRDGGRVVAVRTPLPPDRLLTDKSWVVSPTPLDLALVWVPSGGGPPRTVTSLAGEHSRYLRYPVDQLYFTAHPHRIHVGLSSWRWDGTDQRTDLAVVGREASGELTTVLIGSEPSDVAGVLSPDGQRALIMRKYTLFELKPPAARPGTSDTLELGQAQTASFGTAAGAARRWGRVLAPWISWSQDGRRVLFSQGGTLLVGEVRPGAWTTFARVEVPLTVPVDVPRGTVVLHGARLVTMRGFEVIERGDLVIQDNRIAAVGAVGQVAIPRGARVLDVRGTTILPGYVDVHDHRILPRGVHAEQCWQCLAMLAYGVTTGRDPEPSLDNDVFTYLERERTGELLAPRVFSTGIPYMGADPAIRTLDDARDVVRPHATLFNSETFKVYYDHSTDRRARQLLAMAVAEHELNATVHSTGVELALASAIDGFSGIEHGPNIRIYDDVASLIAGSGATHTQTYGGYNPGSLAFMRRRHGWPWDWATMRRFVPPSAWEATCFGCTGDVLLGYGPPELDNLLPVVRGAARIVAKGGRVAIGGHGNIPALGFHYEMWLHGLGGMPNHEILRSATITGATAIGHAKDLGSLEPGKLADLQILDQNPIEGIHHTSSIRYVMKNGRLYRADDLTEIWPRYKPLPRTYLWETSAGPDAAGATRRGILRSGTTHR